MKKLYLLLASMAFLSACTAVIQTLSKHPNGISLKHQSYHAQKAFDEAKKYCAGMNKIAVHKSSSAMAEGYTVISTFTCE